MTEQDKVDFDNATQCYICNNSIGPLLDKHQSLGKVRNHCQLTGNDHGACHCCCSLHRNNKDVKMHVFFHNLKIMMRV